MKNQDVNIIKLFDIFSEFIVLRKDIEELKKDIVKAKDNFVVFDFDKIVFISRSAMHELCVIKRELENKGIQIKFINLNSDLKKMVDKVKNSKKTNIQKNNFENVDLEELVNGL